MKVAYVAARLATPFRMVDGYLISDGTTVARMGSGEPPPDLLHDADVIDLGGRILAPGFIDAHVHGGGGSDVMDGSAEAFHTVAAQHAAGGTTSFLPTTVCATADYLRGVFEAHNEFRERERQRPSGARSLGLHLEGPYLNPEQSGALSAEAMRTPEDDDWEALLEPWNGVRRMTVAPELAGGMRLGQELRSRGILASIGHSSIRGENLLEALEHGYTLITHFYSGMEGTRRENAYREAGLVEGGYLQDGLWVEVIADGAHLPAELLKLIYKIKGPARILLTTDAMRAAGLGPGEYSLGGGNSTRQVIVEDGVAKLPDRSAFAGSVALASDLVRTMVAEAGVPVLEALQMITVNPARLLRIDECKGRLAPGADADLVVLEDDFSVAMTVVAGQKVFDARDVEVGDAAAARS